MQNKARASCLNHIASALMAICVMISIIGILYKLHGYFRVFDVLVGVSVLAIAILILYNLSQGAKTDRRAIIATMIASVTLLLLWNCVYDAQPVSDYAVLWGGSSKFLMDHFIKEF